MFDVLISKQAKRFIETLSKSYKSKIKAIFKHLSKNPFSYPYKKIKGKKDTYRIRIGKYRLIYVVDKENKVIYIVKIDKRERIYD